MLDLTGELRLPMVTSIIKYVDYCSFLRRFSIIDVLPSGELAYFDNPDGKKIYWVDKNKKDIKSSESVRVVPDVLEIEVVVESEDDLSMKLLKRITDRAQTMFVEKEDKLILNLLSKSCTDLTKIKSVEDLRSLSPNFHSGKCLLSSEFIGSTFNKLPRSRTIRLSGYLGRLVFKRVMFENFTLVDGLDVYVNSLIKGKRGFIIPSNFSWSPLMKDIHLFSYSNFPKKHRFVFKEYLSLLGFGSFKGLVLKKK